jgi:multimeric flavodoxin WrbA
MLVVGVNGSPNLFGETRQLIDVVLEACAAAGAKTQVIHVQEALEGQDRAYCEDCASPCPGTCMEVQNLADAYDLLKDADAVVVGSPVYFGTVSAQLKAFFDKSRLLRKEKGLVGKPAGAVSVGNARFGGQETCVRAIHDILLVHGMRIVSDASLEAGAGHQGASGQRPVSEDAFALERAKILGQGLVEASSKGL